MEQWEAEKDSELGRECNSGYVELSELRGLVKQVDFWEMYVIPEVIHMERDFSDNLFAMISERYG